MADAVTIEIDRDGNTVEAKRTAQALLRSIELGRRQSGKEDGSLWLWSHEGLPVALVELWAINDSHKWGHTMLAVSQERLRGIAKDTIWRPKAGNGVVFKPVPHSGEPHPKSFARKTQMRRMSRRFAANIEDPGRDDRQQFRLLPEPIHRYQGADVQDGAIFAFVRGTSNPEALLFLQSRQGQWEYGFLRCSSNELVAKLDGNEVWTAMQVPGWIGDSRESFWVFHRSFELTDEVD